MKRYSTRNRGSVLESLEESRIRRIVREILNEANIKSGENTYKSLTLDRNVGGNKNAYTINYNKIMSKENLTSPDFVQMWADRLEKSLNNNNINETFIVKAYVNNDVDKYYGRNKNDYELLKGAETDSTHIIFSVRPTTDFEDYVENKIGKFNDDNEDDFIYYEKIDELQNEFDDYQRKLMKFVESKFYKIFSNIQKGYDYIRLWYEESKWGFPVKCVVSIVDYKSQEQTKERKFLQHNPARQISRR